MDALRASYGDTSSDSDSEPDPPFILDPSQSGTPLPPPPLSLLHPPHSAGIPEKSDRADRVRSFPHVEGNYALHVYIPVYIPVSSRKEIALFVKRVAASVEKLHLVDADIPLNSLIRDESKFDQVVLGREYHVSLGRTVPIRVHQRDSVVGMLRHRLQSHKSYWIDFNNWEVFVNDDCTRTFLSLEVIGAGLAEIKKQIDLVNGVYKLHNLPQFYESPRPHISIAWAAGDIRNSLKCLIGEEMTRHVGVLSNKRIFTCKFGGVSCKTGNKCYEICKGMEA